MTKVLKQIRECDGKCCKESPRFPNEDGSDCIYHDQEGPYGCALQRDPSLIPKGKCPVIDMSAKEAVQKTCIDWPHNMPGRDTGGCCWQWVDE